MGKLIINVPDDVLTKVDGKAESLGVTRNTYIVQILRRELGLPYMGKEES